MIWGLGQVCKGAACLGAIGSLFAMNPLGEPQDRVQGAQTRAGATVREMAGNVGLDHPVKRVFFRAFKAEKVLEVWGADQANAKYRLIKTYPIAAMSGGLGPKRKEGDRQVPEGFYVIDRFNPKSSFHLSLGLNYPNVSDRILSDKQRPGSDIFIHGNAVSIGCLAMTDEKIEEIYLLALAARDAGQRPIHVHIFPFRMTSPNLDQAQTPALKRFWQDLKPIYDQFEKTKRVPQVKVDGQGRYSLRN